MAQALVRFLSAQHTQRDGVEHRFIEGCFGIFGHGNLTGVGQALAQNPELLTYYQARNEQAMVHTAAGFAKMRNRLAALACTTSIGPGATNMITGAAAATVNRLPVLLLPGDVFASRRPDPVLQQLESPSRGDVSVNDAFIPVSRYFDRIQRPEQLIPAALSAMRVLTSQVDTGAVTLALPQDVQTEAFDYPAEFFEKRTWRLARPLPDEPALERAAGIIRAARRPLLVAGGGTIYSEATDALRDLVRRTGMPVAETQAGKGSLAYDHAGGLDARRPAQAVAHARRQGLPRRVRVLDDGLRDRRRPGRQACRSLARGLRHCRRRVVLDDGAGDRDLDPGARQAHHRARRQRRLCVDRRPLAIERQRWFRDSVPVSHRGIARRRRRAQQRREAPGRPRDERPGARRPRLPGTQRRRAP